MGFNKKSNDATEKKGMALSDDALSGVTGGCWKVTYRTPDGETVLTTFSDDARFHAWCEKHPNYDIISKESI